MTNDPPAESLDPSQESSATLRMRKGSGDHAVVSETIEPATILKNAFLGDYELLSEIARGGMGIVYKAKQWKLNRVVALKVTLADHLASAEDSLRLHAEATAAARLDHPNIVPIYEVGEADGRRFFSMAFIEGQSLAQTLASGPLPPRRAAELIRQVALAVAYAHSQGVIHRDLKPSNILLDAGGQPRVTDFGLAKCAEGDSGLTKVGEVMGTPSFMSPEQAEANQIVGPATDVYSLGTTLYCLLTGRPPFQAATPLETVKQVVEREPISPRHLNPAVDPDLDTICLKCLQKRPERRYASATDLAEDLQRFLDHRTIQARPVGRVEKLARWCRRNPLVAASLLAACAILLIAFAAVSWSYLQMQDALEVAKKQTEEADLRRRGELWGLYKANISAVASALQLHNVGTARRRLEEAPLEHRNWEWKHFYAQLDAAQHVLGKQELNTLESLITSDGSRVLMRDAHNNVAIWDTAARKKLVEFYATTWRERRLNQTGRLYAHAGFGDELEKTVVVKNVDDGKMLTVLRGHDKYAGSMRYTPDGTRIVTGSEDATARVWDVHTGQQLQVFRGHTSNVLILDVSPDSRRAVSVSPDDMKCCVWDLESGQEIAVLRGRHTPQFRARFSPAGDRFVTLEKVPPHTVKLWDPATGELLTEFHGHTNEITFVTFSPDGKIMATSDMDQSVYLWNVAEWKKVGTEPMASLKGHNGRVHCVRFSPDGKQLVTASQDQTVRLWDAATAAPLAVLHGHAGDVYEAAFMADGKTIVSGARDGTIRLWDSRMMANYGVFRGHTRFVYGVAFHPDGQRVASGAWDGTVRLWDATTGRQLALMRHETSTPEVTSVAFHPLGTLLASLGRDHSVRIWNTATAKEVQCLHIPAINWPDSRVAFHPRGDLLAAGNTRGQIYLWQAASTEFPERDWLKPAEPTVLSDKAGAVRDVAFSHDGRWLASGTETGAVLLWDVASKKKVRVLSGHDSAAYALAWSSDGKWLASGSTDRTVRLWDTTTWEEKAVLKNGADVYGLAFSPDCTRLTAACADNSIRLWDMAKHEEVAELRGQKLYFHAVAFSPDGSRLVSASGDHTVRIWDTLSVHERMNQKSNGR